MLKINPVSGKLDLVGKSSSPIGGYESGTSYEAGAYTPRAAWIIQ